MLENHTDFFRACRSAFGGRLVISCPATVTLPLVGRSRRLIHRTSVDFPAPENPMIPNISPLVNGQRHIAYRVNGFLSGAKGFGNLFQFNQM